MKLDELFPSPYLRASDLQGREITVTISRVVAEQMDGQNGKETKGVVYFENKSKGLVLNKVNGGAIGDVFGPETDDWAGRQIVLFPAKTSFGGRMVDCIRCRVAQPAATQPAPAPEPQPEPAHIDPGCGLADDVPF